MSLRPSLRCRLFGHEWGSWEYWPVPIKCGYLERRKCERCPRAQYQQIPQ